MQPEPRRWNFDDFRPGVVIGSKRVSLPPRFVDQWAAVYARPGHGSRVPMAAVTLILMRAYIEIVTNRPPGSVHVGQRTALHRLPQPTAMMDATVTCVEKRATGERRIVQLSVDILDALQRDRLMWGLMTVFWAQ